MIEVKAPHPYKKTKHMIFLAGSIEMGKAIDWQTKVTEALKNHDITILNPRRDDWDSSWKPTIDDPKFREQVEWELQAHIGELKGKTLGCFCYPLACHGDILAKYAEAS